MWQRAYFIIKKHSLDSVKQQISDYLQVTITLNKCDTKVEHQHKHQIFIMI